MLNTYELDLANAVNFLKANKIAAVQLNNDVFLLLKRQEVEAQRLLDKLYYGVTDLLPVQFHFMLAKSGLDNAMNSLLNALQSVDIEKYAMYKAYLNGARYYEFAKTYAMYEDIKVKLIEIDTALDYNLNQLKTMWIEASNV